MEAPLGPGWSGIVTAEIIEPLAQAIERQFANMWFSTMYHSRYGNAPHSLPQEALFSSHYRLDEIMPRPESGHIWIIARYQWSIHQGTFVALSERGLFVETSFQSGHQAWCWLLED